MKKSKSSFANESELNVGDMIEPVTPAGVWLGSQPVDDDCFERGTRTSTTVFRGVGRVLDVHRGVLRWEDEYGSFEQPYSNFKLCCDGIEGWVGEGAVKRFTSS